MIKAEAVGDSVSDAGVRLLTIKGRLPETSWNEILTHRVLSRNSSSSRAVPAKKWIEEARSPDLRVTPVYWGRNQRGMQSGEEFTGDTLKALKEIWVSGAMDAAYHAERAMRHEAHKEIVNQMLKPYVHANVVITATEWANFFGLRLDQAAKPEVRRFAEEVWKIWNDDAPERISVGDWHLPFVGSDDWDQFPQDLYEGGDGYGYVEALHHLTKVSVARCARVSYESFETGRRSTVKEDVVLYDRLLSGHHMSPFEHVATPDERDDGGPWKHHEQHGNFVGWCQHRKMIPGEAVMELSEEYRA